MSATATARAPAAESAQPTAESAPAASSPAPTPIASTPTLTLAPTQTPAAPVGVPSPVADAVRAPSGGDSLPSSVASPIGSSLGVDPSPVRVHSGPSAGAAAESVSARAFTYGSHIYLGSGESPRDVPLIAHEVTHVVQQQSNAPPSVRLFTTGSSAPYEREAEAASAAVVAGRTAPPVAGRTAPRVQRQLGWLSRAAGAVASGVRAAASAVADVGAGVKERVLNFIREKARVIPGYDLLAFVIGRDPISQQPVERNAINLIRAVVGLIPGGATFLENLQKAGVIQKAGDWFSAEVAKLGFSWEMIRGLFSKAWDALSITDFLNPMGVFEKLKGIFAEPAMRLVNFAKAGAKKLLEFIFEGALALAGGAGQRILSIFRRAQAAFDLIVADPVKFLANLVNAVKGGFSNFAKNILTHLRTGLFEWLTGALKGALTLPQKWDAMGIVGVILQILGLTWDRMRERMVKLLGEPVVKALETAFDFLKTIVTRGLAAAWEKLLEFAAGLVDTVIAGVRDWAAKSIIGAAITKLVTMFNPVGAIIQGIITIYNTVMFFIERAQQIAAVVESVVDSILNIAQGNIGAAIEYVERTMARTLPVIISFLARLIGLGNVSGAVRGIIDKIRGVVDKAIDRVIEFVRTRAVLLLGGRGAAAASSATPANQDRLAAAMGGVRRELDTLKQQGLTPTKLKAAVAQWKARFGFKTLVVEAKAAAFVIKGTINPDGELTEPRPGSRENPFELTWYKRPSANYPVMYFGGKTKGVPRTQKTMAPLVGQKDDTNTTVSAFSPHGRDKLPGGPTIGLTSAYQVAQNAEVGPLSTNTTLGGRVINDELWEYGFRAQPEGFQGDHVREMQFSGPNILENLWPLPARENSSGGSRLARAAVKFPGTSKTITIPELKAEIRKDPSVQYWFRVKGFDY